jgi:4-diphosphocytidyl-2C-methyl-D-erythritol kinase
LLVEPRRAPLAPNFARVQQAALDHGALGASISGAGPSVFGWFEDAPAAHAAAEAMRAAFAEVGLPSDVLVGREACAVPNGRHRTALALMSAASRVKGRYKLRLLCPAQVKGAP